jgi:hypothetical protein
MRQTLPCLLILPPPLLLLLLLLLLLQADISPSELDEVRVKYLSPVFKVDEAEHAALVQQAAQVDKHMKGEASGLDLSEPIDEGDEDA